MPALLALECCCRESSVEGMPLCGSPQKLQRTVSKFINFPKFPIVSPNFWYVSSHFSHVFRAFGCQNVDFFIKKAVQIRTSIV
jgi:hypothetical protein